MDLRAELKSQQLTRRRGIFRFFENEHLLVVTKQKKRTPTAGTLLLKQHHLHVGRFLSIKAYEKIYHLPPSSSSLRGRLLWPGNAWACGEGAPLQRSNSQKLSLSTDTKRTQGSTKADSGLASP